MTCWEQALWMGDVMADKDYQLTVSDSVGPAVVVNITRGSWWANAVVFWAWVESQSGESLSLGVTLDETNAVVRFSGLGRTYSFDLNGRLVTEVAGQGNTSGADYWEAPNIFLPSYPVMQYDVGTAVNGASSVRSFTGEAYTTVGIQQPLRAIQMQFNGPELLQWRSLWSTHFSRGRSCTFWHGQDTFPTDATNPFLSSLGACDQLVVEPSIKSWRGQRTVEYRNTALHDEDVIDYHRRPNVPLSEAGLQSWYIPPTPAW
jgi:hypothetical protein